MNASIALTCAITLCLGCGAGQAEDAAPPSAPLTRLTGETHLHQFPLGAHAWTSFLSPPVPVSVAHGDDLIHLDIAPTLTEGRCTLSLSPTCLPGCTGMSFCSQNDVCSPFPQVTWLDGGEIRVTGSRIVPVIRMWWSAAEGDYAADPPPGPAQLFAGGEVLEVSGGQGVYAVSGRLPAPRPVVVTQPDLNGQIHFPRDAPLLITWVAEGAQQMVLRLSASRSDGHYGIIRCLTPDDGMIQLSQRMMAALPLPPRDIRIEVERSEERTLNTPQPGVGFVVHAAFTAWQNGSE